MRSGRSAISVATARADVVVRHPAAAVDVGEQADAQAGERGRQAGDRHDRRASTSSCVALVRDSRTRRRRSQRADAASPTSVLEDRAAG